MESVHFLQCLLVFVCALLIVNTISSTCPNITATGETKPLYLLTLVPYPDSRNTARLEEGLGTIPGASVARDEINNRTNLLSGYHIELIVESTEACSHTETSSGLASLVKYTVSPPCHPVVAVAGLFCSSHTSVLSPVAGHEGYDLIQLSAANSPIFHDQYYSFPHLWRFIGSTHAYTDAVLALMDHFEWSRIAIVYDSKSTLYRSIATRLQQSVHSSTNKSVILNTALLGVFPLQLEQAVTDIRNQEATIVFAALNGDQSIKLLCRLALAGLASPSYIWIRISTTLQTNYIKLDKGCTRDMLVKAQQKHIVLQVHNHIDDNVVLVSNQTFSSYRENLMRYGGNANTSFDLTYSSLLYDQVWALALAINSSLSTLKNRNLSIDHYSIGQQQITTVIEEQLELLNFQGASGRIQFNDRRGVQTSVKIYEVNGSNEVFVGSFSPQLTSNDSQVIMTYNLSLTISGDGLPDDRLSVVYRLLPLPLAIFLLSVIGVTVIYITAIFIILLFFRKSPEVKATSPYFSVTMFVGCYFICLSAILLVIRVHFIVDPTLLVATTVASLILNDFGTNLYYTTLALKLLRILRIFSTWKIKCHLFWKDATLAIISIIFSSQSLAILLLLLPGQVIIKENSHMEVQQENEVVVVKTVHVLVPNIAISIGLGVEKALVLIVVVLVAVLTRKINRTNFKDTKKVLLLLTVVVYVHALTDGLVGAFEVQHVIPSTILKVAGELIIVIAVVTFLFIPKIFPASQRTYQKLTHTSNSTTTIHHAVSS